MNFYGNLTSQLWNCSICGCRMLRFNMRVRYKTNERARKDKICPSCAYWLDLKEHKKPYMYVIDTTAMIINRVVNKETAKDKSNILGGNGKMRYFIRPSGSVFRSNDIWVIGEVPEHFRKYFTKTVREITEWAFNKIKKETKAGRIKCKARACLDRYHCFRYDIGLEKELGAFNQPPKDWKVGGEHCGFLINIDKVYINPINQKDNEKRIDEKAE